MKVAQLAASGGFRIGIGNARSQCAMMVLAPGQKEGGPDNRHAGADQLLFVVGGSGHATVNGHTLELRIGTALLIEAGERHEISNTGSAPLETLNVYVPPAYDSAGEELPAGRNE